MAVIPDFPNSYWVIEGRLAAGEYPVSRDRDASAARLGRLIDAGIDFFLDLTQPGELEPYDKILQQQASQRGRSVDYMRMPIRDMHVPVHDEMCAILNAIDSALASGRTVYVHCWGGVGRTGTVVGCHLVRHGSTGADALDRVATLFGGTAKSAYRQSPETDAQCAFVREWLEPRAGAHGNSSQGGDDGGASVTVRKLRSFGNPPG